MLYPFFRPSFVLELYWQDSIDLEMGDEIYFYEDKMYNLKEANITTWKMGH